MNNKILLFILGLVIISFSFQESRAQDAFEYTAAYNCNNPVILNDTVQYFSVDTGIQKYWFKFKATGEKTSLLIFDGEGNQHCDHLVFEILDNGLCKQIQQKKLLQYRDKVVERFDGIDTDTCMSVESIKYGYCNCERCRGKSDIMYTVPGREYLVVVYGAYFALQIGVNSKSMQNMLIKEGYSYDPFKQFDLQVGKSIELNNILFKSNSDRFLPESYEELSKLLDFMIKHPNVQIEIEGHVNAPREKPSKSLMELSDKRADAVYSYLVKAGIDKNRMTTRGYGNTRMIYPKAREEKQFIRNRRVEILITDILINEQK